MRGFDLAAVTILKRIVPANRCDKMQAFMLVQPVPERSHEPEHFT